MSELKKIKKEAEWADDIPQEDAPDTTYEKTYRDGSAVHECWAEEKEADAAARE